jgi:hypothetical protein
MSKSIIAIIMLLCSSISLACKLGPNSQWKLSEADLDKAAKNVVVARLEEIKGGKDSNRADLKFTILKVKKGKYKNKDLVIRNVRKTDSDSITYDKKCNFEFNYKLNREYLIYINTLNPNSIKAISSDEK